MATSYNLNNISDVLELLDDKEFTDFMFGYLSKPENQIPSMKPIAEYNRIKNLMAPFGSQYTNFGFADRTYVLIQKSIEAFQKYQTTNNPDWKKTFDYDGNQVSFTTRLFGQLGWTASIFVNAMYTAGTLYQDPWGKLQVARQMIYLADEGMLLAKNLWLNRELRAIDVQRNSAITHLESSPLGSAMQQRIKEILGDQAKIAKAKVNKNANIASTVGSFAFMADAVMGLVRLYHQINVEFGKEKPDRDVIKALYLQQGTFISLIGGHLAGTIGNFFGAAEQVATKRTLLAVLESSLPTTRTALWMTSNTLNNISRFAGIASSVLLVSSLIFGIASEAYILHHARSRMTPGQIAALSVEIGMQSAAAVIMIGLTMAMAAGALGAGPVGTAITAVSIGLLFSPIQIQNAVSYIQLGDQIDRISRDYQRYGFSGYKYLADFMQFQGGVQLSGPVSIGAGLALLATPLGALGGLLFFGGIIGQAIYQNIIEAKARSLHRSIIADYGSMANYWQQSYDADARMLVDQTDFAYSTRLLAQSLAQSGTQRLVQLLSLGSNELQRNMAAIISEGGTLPPNAFYGYISDLRTQAYNSAFAQSIFDTRRGTINLNTPAISQYVTSAGPLFSPSAEYAERTQNGKNEYTTTIVYSPKQWTFQDGDSATTIELHGLSARNADNNDTLPAKLYLAGGNDTVIAGPRHFVVDGGSGFNGVDYSSLLSSSIGDSAAGKTTNKGIIARQAEDGTITVTKSGLGRMAVEESKKSEISVGKRKESIEYLSSSYVNTSFTGTDTLYNIQWIEGSIGNDQFFGASQTNFFVASSGTDSYDGGNGTDWVDYSVLPKEAQLHQAGLFISLDRSKFETKSITDEALNRAGITQGGATYVDANGTTTWNSLKNIENIRGTLNRDIIWGDDSDNIIVGGGGSDWLYGGSGNDQLASGNFGDSLVDGGDGTDTADYALQNVNLVARLAESGSNGEIRETSMAAGQHRRMVGRYILVRHLPNIPVALELAEIRVISDGINVAYKARVVESSAGHFKECSPANLVDGDISSNPDDVYESNYGAGNAWVMIDLGTSYTIDSIEVMAPVELHRTRAGADIALFVSNNDLSPHGANYATLKARDDVAVAELPAAYITPHYAARGSNLQIAYGVYNGWVEVRHLGIDERKTLTLRDFTGNSFDDSPRTDTLRRIENLRLGSGSDDAKGNSGTNLLDGGAGNDSLDGDAGDDFLLSGQGQDTLRGGLGNDILQIQHGLKPTSPLTGRYILIRHLPGISRFLAFSEVEVWASLGTTNSARRSLAIPINAARQENAKVIESPDGHWNLSSGAGLTDGIISMQGNGADQLAYHSASSDGNSWVMIDIGMPLEITKINLASLLQTPGWHGPMGTDIAVFVSEADLSTDATNWHALTNRPDVRRAEVTAKEFSASSAIHSVLANDFLPGTNDLSKLIDGGEGMDSADYHTAFSIEGLGIQASLATGCAKPLYFGKQGAYTFCDTLAGIENLSGTEAADELEGDNNDNQLAGYDGGDSLRGGAGQDTILTGFGRDSVDAGEDNDTIYVQHGATLRGRYLLVRKNDGVNDHLSLAEIQVMKDGQNLALKQATTSSGEYDQGNHRNENINDGNTGGNAEIDRIFASLTRSNGWIQIDLGASRSIDVINILGRTVVGQHQSGDFTVYLAETPMGGKGAAELEAAPGVIWYRQNGALTQNASLSITRMESRIVNDPKTLDGGNGTDLADYRYAYVGEGIGIVASLSEGLVKTAYINGRLNPDSTTDSLRNIEGIGGTSAGDILIGNSQDNQINGYAGDDLLDSGAGNDLLRTGSGRDTAKGGDGDDVTYVQHAMPTQWATQWLTTDGVSLSTSGRVSDIDFADPDWQIGLDGGAIGACPGTVVSLDRSQSGKVSLWVSYFTGTHTKAVNIRLSDNAQGGITAQTVRAKYFEGNHASPGAFDWDRYGYSMPVAESSAGNGYGISSLRVNNLNRYDDEKIIDGGEGNDIVDYSEDRRRIGVGIDASLVSNEVRTWLSRGTAEARSAVDRLSNVEGLGGTSESDRLSGNAQGNQLIGYGGGDHIDGGAGDDVIATGTGADTILAGEGNDRIFASHQAPSLRGRYVLIRKNDGVTDHLSLAEVEIMKDGGNLAQGKTVTSSGAYDQGSHKEANLVDGKTGGNHLSDGIFASASKTGSWVQIDLGSASAIDSIKLYGRTDWPGQSSDFTVYLSDSELQGLSLNQLETQSGIQRYRQEGMISTLSITRMNGHIDAKQIDGGDGYDFLSYRSGDPATSTGGIEAMLDTGIVSTWWSEGAVYARSVSDSINGIEAVGGTDAGDHLVGDAQKNQLLGYSGSDNIDGGAGDDMLFSGTGRDTLQGGEGDDSIYVEHGERHRVTWSSSWLSGGGTVLARLGRIDDIDLSAADTLFRLDGGSIGSMPGRLLSLDRTTPGQIGIWIGSFSGAHTKAVKIILADNATGGVSAYAVSAKYIDGDVTGAHFDWDTSGYSMAVAESNGAGGYGIAQLALSGLSGYTDDKQIDGGSGNNTVDYHYTQTLRGIGINASLATGRVETWYANGTTQAGSAVDTLRNIANINGTQAGDRLVGDNADNKISGLDGDDVLIGAGGADVIATGIGQDTVDGGEGDDMIQVAHEGAQRWNTDWLNSTPYQIASRARVADIDLNDPGTSIRLDGGAIGPLTGKVISIDRGQPGSLSFWVGSHTGGYTKAVNIRLTDTAGGGINAQVMQAKYFEGDLSQPGVFDWNTYGHTMPVAQTIDANGYGVAGLLLYARTRYSDGKRIDGGNGNDLLDYSQDERRADVGIDASLMTGKVQTCLINGAPDTASCVDEVQNIEGLGGTNAADRLQGNALANQLVGHAGADWLDGGDGNDTLATGLGRDTVSGGAGDDAIFVTHGERAVAEWAVRWVNGAGQSLCSLGRVADIDIAGKLTRIELDGGSIGATPGKILASDRSTPGVLSLWVGTFTGLHTKAIRVVLVDNASGGITAYATGAKYTHGNVIGTTFNWDTQGSQGYLAGGASDIGYGIAQLHLAGLSGFSDEKVLDGGEGNADSVSYRASDLPDSIGIDASLQSGEVGTWFSGSANVSGSCIDQLRNIEQIGGTDAADRLRGNEVDNTLFGYGGNDLIEGGGGNDKLYTGTGEDRVNGGQGDDTIFVEHRRALLSGRYLLIRHQPDVARHLALSEIAIWANGENVARRPGVQVYQSSDGSWTTAVGQHLVDGVTSVSAANGELGFYHSATADGSAWAMIDLGQSYTVDGIDLTALMATPGLYGPLATDLGVFISDKDLRVDAGNYNALTSRTDSRYVSIAGNEESGARTLGRDGSLRLLADDFIGGGSIDAKTIDGGEGEDLVSYRDHQAQTGVGIDGSLASGQVKTWFAKGNSMEGSVIDTLRNVENLAGTEYGDKLSGDNKGNKLAGFDGDDEIDGGDGNDMIFTGAGRDTIRGEGGDDIVFTDQESAILKGRYLLIRHQPGITRHLAFEEVRVWSNGINVALNAHVLESGDGHWDTASGVRLVDGTAAAYHSLTASGKAWIQIDLGQSRSIDRIELQAILGTAHGPMAADIGVFISESPLATDALDYLRLSSRSDTSFAEINGSTFNGQNNLLSASGQLSLGVERFIKEKKIDGGSGEDFVSYRESQGAKGVGIDGSLSTGKVFTWFENGTVRAGSACDTLIAVENLGGTEVADRLAGKDGANKLLGYGGNDTLTGAAGNDQLAGGTGSDIYKFAAGWGADAIFEEQEAGSTEQDTAIFDDSVSYTDLWFSRQDNSLAIQRLNSSDSILINDWYVDPKARIERFQSGGYALMSTQVDAFVQALAQVGSSALINHTAAANQILARYWIANPL